MKSPRMPSRIPLAILAAALLATACAGTSRDATDEAADLSPRYVGELDCRDCAAILTSVSLFKSDSFLLEETYRGTSDGDRKYTSRGSWAALTDATDPAAGSILMLSPRVGETRRFRMLGDTALRQLDRTGRPIAAAKNDLLVRDP